MSGNKNLFGELILEEESFEIKYRGSSFDDGKVLISTLTDELKSLEELLKDSVKLLISTNKIDKEFKDFQIFIGIEKGSLLERVKIVFKNKTTIAIVGTMIIPFINTTYEFYLNRDQKVLGDFAQEIEIIQEDYKFRKNFKNILAPLNNEDDTLSIVSNNSEEQLKINYENKETINKNINTPIAQENDNEEEYKKNGEFKEELIGVIRKLDLDAAKNNIFGFNIENGPSRIPTSIQGEFNLLDYKDIIDQPIKIKANVKYKDDEIKHIEIIERELINKQKQTGMEFF